MSIVAPFSHPKKSVPGSLTDPRLRQIRDEIMKLLSSLLSHEQERILHEIECAIHPIATPRAGEVLGTIARLLPRRSEWSVEDIKESVQSEGIKATSKEVFNAIGYLTRKGHIQRIGYGRYLIGGIAVETSDDLGVEPTRNECE
jgi:hypothetical protein